MKRSTLLVVADAPPTGTEGIPPNTGCIRIQTDQQGVPWEDMAQPWGVSASPVFIFVRGKTSLAVGRFENYFYFVTTGGFDQYLILSDIAGTWGSNEILQKAVSRGGPWTDTSINTATPPGQDDVDCDIGCAGAECDPGGVEFFVINPNVEIILPGNAPDSIVPAGTNPFDEWTGLWSYDTTIPGGDPIPFASGSLTGSIEGAVAEIARWTDPGVGLGNLVLFVYGVTVGRSAMRFIHGELLDHGASTGQVTLSNPMLEDGPIPPPEP